jgi:hypothetical protein
VSEREREIEREKMKDGKGKEKREKEGVKGLHKEGEKKVIEYKRGREEEKILCLSGKSGNRYRSSGNEKQI